MIYRIVKKRHFLQALLFLIVLQSQIYGQVRFDYINDWSHIFLSNINQVSAKSAPFLNDLNKTSDQNMQISSHLIFNDFYRERHGNVHRDISLFQHFTTLHKRIRLYGQEIKIGTQFGISQKILNYDITESQSIRLLNAFKEYQFFIATDFLEDYLTVGGGLGKKIIDDSDINTWNIGVSFQPVKLISFSYHRYEDFFRWEYHFHIDDAVENLIADEYSQLDEYQIKLHIGKELSIVGNMQNNFINQGREVKDESTILIPTGTQYQRHILLSLFPREQFNINLSYYNRDHNLKGYFYNAYQVFGKLTEQKDHSEFYLSEFIFHTQSHIYGLNLGWAEGMIRNNGNLESWPFTSTMIDLLGLKYSFKSNLTYSLFRLGASYQYRTSDFQLSIRSNFESIKPVGGARSWQPEFLAFGIKNLNVFSLSQDSWDGMYLGLQVRKSFSALFQLSYEFHQYIPLEFGNGGQPANSSGEETIDKSIYGGGKHVVYLTISL
jgi:hypothetical protein